MREFAVPPSMIDAATARRRAGDWAGACRGGHRRRPQPAFRGAHACHDLATRVRADLRHLAPDLLRWHMPRIAPDGLLRAWPHRSPWRATAARDATDRLRCISWSGPRPPKRDGGQRISLALWDGSGSDTGVPWHPHPRPALGSGSTCTATCGTPAGPMNCVSGRGADLPPTDDPPRRPDPPGTMPPGRRGAVDRWAAEAGLLLRAEGSPTAGTTVTVRLGAGRRLALVLATERIGAGPHLLRIDEARTGGAASCAAVAARRGDLGATRPGSGARR
ncbi:hypothetical protein LV779_35755 [Streptomyces thinghirensis]|nr:hypothetical protein [Streptomyces thinghirensis]